MLHLFNEVFIEQEQRMSVPIGSRVIIISSQYNTDMAQNENCLTCVDTLDEAIGEGTLESFIRDTMSLTGKIVIYANDEAFARIFTSWIKSSTNMEADDFDIYLKTYKFRCITNSKHWQDLFDALAANWATAPAYDFSDVDFIPSYELMLASAFYDSNFAKKDKLIFLMSKFIKREYEDVVLEVRKHIDSLILDKDVQLLLGGTSYISEIDLETIKEDLPKLQLYKAPYWREDVFCPTATAYRPGTFARGDSKIDISLATPEELTELFEFTEDFLYLATNAPDTTKELIASFYESRGWVYKDSVATGVLTDEEYQTALSEILDEKYHLRYVPLDLRESILLHIVPYFKTLKNTGQLEKLQKFTLK